MLLSDTQQLIRDTIRAFAAERLAPAAARWDREGHFPREELRALGDLGAMGVVTPERWGGAGLDYVSLAVALEEIAAGDGATSTIVSVQNSVVCGPVAAFGTDAQKEHYLKPLARGERLGCFCLTEPQVGSDAGAIATRAERAGDHYVLNGVKQFITTGKNADVAVVFAVTDRDAGKKGISGFIVDTKSPGYVVARVEDKLGQRASDTAQILFDNCKVPATNLLGREGEGYRIALSNLEAGRIGIAAQAVGMARAAFEAALAYARERTSFGTPLTGHQAISFRLADMATEIEVARQMVWHAAALRDAGQPCLKEASMAKLFASEMAERVCSAAIQVHGGYGYVNDFPVERIYRDVRVCQIYEGTSEIQRLVIGRALAA
jgi:alkylation response protein AidB-like acyl-CoA dehydrogenase